MAKLFVFADTFDQRNGGERLPPRLPLPLPHSAPPAYLSGRTPLSLKAGEVRVKCGGGVSAAAVVFDARASVEATTIRAQTTRNGIGSPYCCGAPLTTRNFC